MFATREVRSGLGTRGCVIVSALLRVRTHALERLARLRELLRGGSRGQRSGRKTMI